MFVAARVIAFFAMVFLIGWALLSASRERSKTLVYKSHALIEDLQLGECTVHRCGTTDGKRGWNLWFYVARETDGVPEDFVIPVNPGGGYTENGPLGKTWGFTNSGGGVWQVSPSINVVTLPSGTAIAAGVHPATSLWHQTPSVVSVPDGEPWQ